MEKISYQAWQKQFGRSVGLRAPGMLMELLKRTGAAHGRHPARSEDAEDQTLAILSRLWQDGEKAVVAAVAWVRVWRRPQSLSEPTQEPIFLLGRGRLQAWNERLEPPAL